MAWADAGASMAMLDVQNGPGPNGVGAWKRTAPIQWSLAPERRFPIKSCEIGGGRRSDAGLPRRFDDIDAQSVDTIVGVGFSLHMTQECFAGTLGPDARPQTT
jgi:hypothetical protein